MKIDKKIKNLIFGMFDTMIQGADKYISESSTWLIFTEERRWVLEFTKEKILWFNYNTFQSELNLLSIDCVESKDIIKKWFESRFLGIEVENTIQNGVKNSQSYGGESLKLVEDTIQNGVKSTFIGSLDGKEMVENTIKNGVKHTLSHFGSFPPPSKNNIQNVIQNGVKNTFSGAGDNYYEVDDTIQNGVKESYPHYFEGDINVKDTIKNGVKLLMDGNERNPAWEGKVQDAIQNGVKDTWIVVDNIQNGVKDISNGSYPPQFFIEDIIQNGVKEVEKGSWFNTICADEVIDNGKKDIYPIYGVSDKKIEDTIQNGVKLKIK